jgi:transposase
LRGRVKRLENRVDELLKALEKAKRRRKRQASPFSKDDPKAEPKKPGRKSGPDHGPTACRPHPEHIDEEHEAPLASSCPCCGGNVVEKAHEERQYQTDVPQPRPIVRQFNIHVGECERCGRRVQGRHPLQTSDAIGAAANQLGPNVLALATHMNKELGVPYGKIAAHLRTAFGLEVSRGALVRAVRRIAKKAEPAYAAAVEALRKSDAVYPDETGWRIGGHRAWLWAFVGDDVTVYGIRPSRGFDVVDAILGKDYSGLVGSDGWCVYAQLDEATKQTCNAHLIRRCSDMLEVAVGGAVHFPRDVKQLLQDGLRLRDRRRAGEITEETFIQERSSLEARLGALFRRNLTDPANARLWNHLAAHHDEIFTYLYDPVEATNWPAEQAIRGSVVARKLSGGNRTDAGAHTHEVLLTVFRSLKQHGKDAVAFIRDLLFSSDPNEVAQAAFT